MDENLRLNLIEAKIDIDEAMERLMNKFELFERFVKRFPTEESFNKLQNALVEGNADAAFRAAHSLKGVCANMSMNDLKESVSAQVEYLRAGNLEAALEINPEVVDKYQKMVADINKIFGV